MKLLGIMDKEQYLGIRRNNIKQNVRKIWFGFMVYQPL